MRLIIYSLLMGYIGLIVAAALGEPGPYMYLFISVGVLSPVLFLLQKIYVKLKKMEEKCNKLILSV